MNDIIFEIGGSFMKIQTEKDYSKKYMKMARFIDATKQIIETEGIENITIRKVSEVAGFNSATIYHYFDNLDELIYFSAIGYTSDYVKDLHGYISKYDNYIDRYFSVWECFCNHAYRNPKVWKLLFSGKFTEQNTCSYYNTYYKIFPSEMSDEVMEFRDMLTTDSLYEREYLALKKSLKYSNIDISDDIIHEINQMNLIIYNGMLSYIIDNPESDVNLAVEKTIAFMKKTLSAFNIL